ncbi:MAG TPA: M48 family metallopeptidase [Saprospiraceae bacterium]|nr:M48 family metallopeptidase [Saprospiraceae bacterium]HQW54728.1 M48 family metallopeptidase [Saprospiraceae bacterium]
MRFYPYIFISLMLSVGTMGCKSFNAFSIDQDKQLGDQVSSEIASKPKEYPLLPESGNAELYSYVRSLVQTILNTGTVTNKNNFSWNVKIIDDPKVLNAFCTPGGHIYVYTGLIKFLDSEDELIGVMGHEIAHADLRHSTKQLTKQYGISIITEALVGNQSALAQIAASLAGGLAGLQFSRSDESEADAQSVTYLCGTNYKADGAAGFFRKMEAKGGNPPEWLSTHPNPSNRIANMEKKKNQLGCTGTETNTAAYARIKSLIK